MIAYPGGDAYIYLDVTRNGEPVVTETQPMIVALIHDGFNMLANPVVMGNLDVGLYVGAIPIPPSAPQGNYLAVMQFRRLGKDRRETVYIDVVKDASSTLTPIINSVRDFVEALLPQNTRYEFVRAEQNVPARNVAAGRLDKIKFMHKHPADQDYTTPVAQGERLFVYETVGDVNPIIVEGM